MKKRMIAVLLVLAMILTFAGCSKKTTIVISFTEIESFEIVQIPESIENLSHNENSVSVTVKKDGEYPIVIKTEDGTEHTLNIKYEKGTAYVDAGDLECISGVK